MPTFSIIVPAYNVQDYIEEALTSIAGQSFADFEAIIVDDGSTDATGAIVQAFCAGDSRFRYIHQPNRGQSTARNVGTAVASGTYLYYMDSDDIIDADTLDLCFREFTRQEIDVVMFEASAFPVDAPTYKREENSYLRPLGKVAPMVGGICHRVAAPEAILRIAMLPDRTSLGCWGVALYRRHRV